jgi:hypothetical protein
MIAMATRPPATDAPDEIAVWALYRQLMDGWKTGGGRATRRTSRYSTGGSSESGGPHGRNQGP